MDYHSLTTLRREHAGWRLLAADHAPLVISLLYRYFVQPNVRTLSRDELVSRLDDDLARLNDQLGDLRFPKGAAQYLDDWASDERAWLRKYYPPGTDEPHYDITPATEKVIDWISQLRDRPFVGTESRLLTVFELLRQMTEGTESNPAVRLAELERRKAKIESEMQRVREGDVPLMDPTKVKDRFLQMASTARGLLTDFRDVEQNFRALDRQVRELITTWEEGRGELLDLILGDRDAIEQSDQGKSFRAFWDFLMSPDRQEELSALLNAVLALEPVRELDPDPRIARIHFDWLEAGEVAQRTVARLSEQLRRYLDDQALRENRRILQIIREVEQRALAMRGGFPDGPSMLLDEPAPEINLDLDRLLYRPPFRPSLDATLVKEGSEDISADVLFEQRFVDPARLRATLSLALEGRSQVSLRELLLEFPLEEGLSELVTWLSLAAEDDAALIDDAQSQVIVWEDDIGFRRQATLPLVIFVAPSSA